MNRAWLALALCVPFLGSCAPDPAVAAPASTSMEDVADYLPAGAATDDGLDADATTRWNRCFAIRCSSGYTCCPVPACPPCLPDGLICSRAACARP